MFGGLAFMVNGHMCCGIVDKDIVVRTGREQYEAALSKPALGSSLSQDWITNGDKSAAHSILARSDQLQQRPYTFAQTNLSCSLFACDEAADHTFRVARENEAAGATDAAAWVPLDGLAGGGRQLGVPNQAVACPSSGGRE